MQDNIRKSTVIILYVSKTSEESWIILRKISFLLSAYYVLFYITDTRTYQTAEDLHVYSRAYNNKLGVFRSVKTYNRCSYLIFMLIEYLSFI